MKLANMKITTRLSATLGLLVSILLALAALSMWEMGVMRSSTQEITENWLPSVELVNRMNTNTSDYRIGEVSHVLATDAKDMARLEKEMADVMADFNKNHDAYVKLISSEEERKIHETFAADWKVYLQLHDQMIAFSRNNETEKARAVLEKESKPVFDRASATLDKIIALNHEGSEAESKLAEEAYASARNAMAAGVLAALAVALVAGIWLVRSIAGPLRKAVAHAESVAAGDFTNVIEAHGEDEAAQLLKALARMQNSLSQIVSSVRRNAEGVASASSQIAQGNQDLSQRTEEQASALEETAASMEQLGSTVKQNAEHASQANQLAMGATTVAIKGGEVVSEVVTTMKGINDSSKRIADIISVIDGIAFQTNILALNAAVEAARAGEQGRGFAVVASEVRNLAGRSAEAAKEIKSLIMASVERVEQGTALVDQAGVTMTEVVSAIQRVTNIMGEISAASAEQSAGVTQVGEAVSQMDQVTQQNAALVEEGAAAASSLNSQAHALVESVAFFKLDQSARSTATAATVTPAAAPTAPAFVERRGPNRATNVMRPKFGTKTAVVSQPKTLVPTVSNKTGTDDEWEKF